MGPKLAEYVFVPMSHVLKTSQKVPLRALELCLECLLILLQTGWRSHISPDLAGQFLILLTYLANPSPTESGIPATSEDLQVAAFKCMDALFIALASTSQSRQSLTTTTNIPALGRAVLTILDSLVDSNSFDVQISAAATLYSIVLAIDDRDALASFLPRMVSSLTKVLTPSSTHRPKSRLLETCLNTLSQLFTRVLGDHETKNLPTGNDRDANESGLNFRRTTSWLKATSSQVKIALANVFKLRHHDRTEVHSALYQLCVVIIRDCRKSLSDCIGMAIETMVTLSGNSGQGIIEEKLQNLLLSDSDLSELLRESLHDWLISLPRLMQSKDDRSRQQIVHQVSIAFRLLSHCRVDLSIINRLLAENLRDSVSNIWSETKNIAPVIESPADSMMDPMAVLSSHRRQFEELTLPYKGQDEMMKEFKLLIRELSTSEGSSVVAQDLVSFIRSGRGVPQLASFWISFNLLQENTRNTPALENFLNLDEARDNVQTELLDELYSFALSAIAESETETGLDWRFHALSLEVIALQARELKMDFRVELIDTLYPVIHLLGSSNMALRKHAITCLDILADACGYNSTSDLVVSNVDYLVNAVALKLNTFDISPQAPQVLLMLVRLCGPSLLPYLDDLVESMFSALENFHGYPKLVELIFSVLKGMTEEGIKAPQLAITAGEESLGLKGPTKTANMGEVAKIITDLTAASLRKDADIPEALKGVFPRKPWKEDTEISTSSDFDGQDESLHDQQPEAPEPEPEPPAPKTYSILLKISQLTQHYLTSSSPSLRNSLLSLLNTTIPALARHENSFLPLINTLWPVLLPRISDNEAYIVANTLDTIGVMCQYAGDFMKSRIEQTWEDIKDVYRRTYQPTKRFSRNLEIRIKKPEKQQLFKQDDDAAVISTSAGVGSHQEFYVDAPSRLIWDSLTRLLCMISAYVTIREEFFDDIMDMLEPVLDDKNVVSSLETRNADAVWLRRLKMNKRSPKESPGGLFFKPPPISGNHNWPFVPLDVHGR